MFSYMTISHFSLLAHVSERKQYIIAKASWATMIILTIRKS